MGKRRRYPALELTVLHAKERTVPPDRAQIEWKLITNLPVNSKEEAVEKLQWYALRWRIEVFHKILKSGCQAEHSKLRTAERIVNLLSMFCVLSRRIFWLTMHNRCAQTIKPSYAFTTQEIEILSQLRSHRQPIPQGPPTMKACLNQLARLGGYLDRASDPPPGNMVIWRGMARLTDIQIGFPMSAETCG